VKTSSEGEVVKVGVESLGELLMFGKDGVVQFLPTTQA